jgi:hypothetical protein
MVADPAPAAVTKPLPVTVATADALVDQVMDRPVMMFPLASRSTAASWDVWPTVRLTVVGFSATVATGTTLTVN